MERDPEELPALPLREDEIFAALGAHDVQYVLIGGAALLLMEIGNRETFDLDIVPSQDPSNLDRLGLALGQLDARVVTVWDAQRQEMHVEEAVLDARVFLDNRILHVVTSAGRMDVLAAAPGAAGGYDALAGGALTLRRGDATVMVAGVPDLIRMKEAVGRPKDLEDLVGLRGSLEQMSAQRQPKPRSPRSAPKKRSLDARRQDEARRRSSSIDRDRGLER